MNDWKMLVCLAHAILWMISKNSRGRCESDIELRADAIVTVLEADDVNDAEEGSDKEEDWQNNPDDDPEDDGSQFDDEVHEVDGEGMQSLLGALGMDWAELVESARCFNEGAMCFSLLLKLDNVVAFFHEHRDNDELETLVAELIEENRNIEELSDLLPLWKGCRQLHDQLREELAFQWLLAGEFLSRSIVVKGQKIPTAKAVRKAIGKVAESRMNGRHDLPSLFQTAEATLTPRLLEIARMNAPDADEQIELFDAMGGVLDCNRAANEVPKAIRAYLEIPSN
jgi:hypothetical protein